MTLFRVHAVVYSSVNTMLVAIWAAAGANLGGFWPIWPIITWGAALGIHSGITEGGRRSLRVGRRRELSDGPRIGRLARRRALAGPAPTSELVEERREWVAVMFVDIVGSTRLNDELGDQEWYRLLREHRTLVRDAVRDGGGTEVGTAGDGSLSRFDSPAAAVGCATDIQIALSAQRQEGGQTVDARIGIHAGEALNADRDLLGRVVNLASRVADEAQAGEILVTEPVADELGSQIAMKDMGLRSMKGLDRPRHLLAVRWSTDS